PLPVAQTRAPRRRDRQYLADAGSLVERRERRGETPDARAGVRPRGCDARRVQDVRAQHRVPPRARGAAYELREHLPQAHADPRRDSRFRLLRDRRRRLAAGEGEPRAAAEGEVLDDEREVAEILDGELQAAARRDDEETALRRRGDGEDQMPLADPEADRVPRCLAPW